MSRGKSGTHRHTLGQKEKKKEDKTCIGGRKKKKERKRGQNWTSIFLLFC